MTFRAVRRLLADDGWQIVRSKGSHEQWRHSTKRGTVTVAGRDGDEVAPKTLQSILRQAGMR
jgi:predicted RNA binding protein YcfA (HicA-like mRNA interferase family)